MKAWLQENLLAVGIFGLCTALVQVSGAGLGASEPRDRWQRPCPRGLVVGAAWVSSAGCKASVMGRCVFTEHGQGDHGVSEQVLPPLVS